MDKKVYMNEKLISLFICLLYSNFAYLAVLSATTIVIPETTLVLYCSGMTLLVFIIANIKFIRIGVIWLTALFLLSVVIRSVILIGTDATLEEFRKFSLWISDCIVQADRLMPSQELLISIAIAVLISIYAVIFIDWILNPFLLFLLAGVLFASQILTGNLRQEIYYFFLIGTTALAGMKASYKISQLKSKVKMASFGRIFIQCVLVSAVTLVIAVMLPVQSTPLVYSGFGFIKQQPLNNKGFNIFVNRTESGMSEDNARLGGEITLDNTRIMTVTGSERVYLTGDIKTIYTGSSWKRDINEVVDYNGQLADDTNEILLNSRNNGIDLSLKELTVKRMGYPSKTVFTPADYNRVNFSGAHKVVINLYGCLTASPSIKEAEEYTVSYYDTEPLKEMLDSSYEGYYEEKGQPELAQKALTERARNLVLPRSLPKRVGDLAREITKDSKTDYERAQAIEQYLARFPYTLKPGNTPKDRDFVDYFLFDEKQGYCVYYASAMTVLCRSVGIPARYVEGYAQPPSNSVKKLENGKIEYTLTNEQAHAWTEVYFEGLGWQRFEPTPPYTYINNGQAVPDTVFSQEMLEDKKYQNYVEDFKKEEQGTTVPGTAAENKTESGTNAGGTGSSPGKKGGTANPDENRKGIYFLLIPLFLVLVCVVSMLCIFAVRYRKRVSRGESSEPELLVLSYFTEIFAISKLLHNENKAGETMYEYLSRLGDDLNLDSALVSKGSQVFDKCRFSRNKATKEEVFAASELHNAVRETALLRFSRVKRFIYRNILNLL